MIPSDRTIADVAGHPAFYDPEKELLAEALPGHVYRFTRQEKDCTLTSMVVSPDAHRVWLETRAKSKEKKLESYVIPPESLNEYGGKDFYDAGEKLLAEHGCRIEEDPAVKMRLQIFARAAENGPHLEFKELKTGDAAALVYQSGGYKDITVFNVVSPCKADMFGSMTESDEAKIILQDASPNNRGVVDPEGKLQVRWDGVAGSSNFKITAVTPGDRFWVKKIARFYGGDGSPDAGKRLFRKAMEIEDMQRWRLGGGWNPCGDGEVRRVGTVAI